MSFQTDAALKTAVAGRLKQSESDLPDYWDEIVSKANTAAYQEIVSRLTARGYSQAVINAWSRGNEFQHDIGLFWALVHGGGYSEADDRFINKLDRRNELDTVLVEIESRTVGRGKMSTRCDRFTMDTQF